MPRDHGPKPDNVASYDRQVLPPDDNFENLINNWEHLNQRITIFMGAGASVGARNCNAEFLPSALSLRNDIWKSFMCSATERVSFDPSILGMMSLEHAAAIAEARAGRTALIETLTSRFDCHHPLWQHAVLPFLQPKALFTTNYDELIEKGWQLQAGKAGIRETGVRYSATSLNTSAPRISLFKPHGTLHMSNSAIGEGGLVITMFDYFRMIGDYREMIEQFLSNFNQTCVIFIGYAFMDMDIGAELYRLRRIKKDIPWYAVFPRNDGDVREMYRAQFDIRQINRKASDFFAELDERIDFIPTEWKFPQIAQLQARGLIQ
ncbi:SIR2 family protein [Bradyrhizobium brasilense]|uniref:SIR2 family protein n=1 Tax=Bradyrhizobium brasilense TaxID=1419277 RepID=UPI00145677DA|nr:SIR2 family protein [Bradyrhizobium brasilense]NLS69337.1 SIR2 family protein [Bradyrhizobium brasilense]